MKKISALRLMAAAILTAAALPVMSAATLNYGFDSATLEGKTILASYGANNTSGPTYGFDTAVYSSAPASFQMTGTTGSQFGYFYTMLNVGLLSTSGTVQNFNSTDTNISFKIRNDTTGQTGTSIYIRLFKNSDLVNHVASYFTTSNSGNTGGSFATVSTAMLSAPNTLAGGWSFGGSYTYSDLADIGTVRLQPSWSAGTSGLAMNYHLDTFSMSGSGISMIPEPTVSLLVLGGLAALGLRFRKKNTN